MVKASRKAMAGAPAGDKASPPRADAGSAVVTLDADVRTMGEGAYNRLRSDLLAGRIAPGARLPFRQLSTRYDVGIGPLREALVRLASERLVSFEGQRGFMVAPLSLPDLHDLCRLRVDLSCRALRQSIERGGEDWEDEILVTVHRLARSRMPGSSHDEAAIDEWERRHDRFHASLLAACGSHWLLHFCSTLSDQFQRYRRCVILQMSQSHAVLDEVRDQHRAVADAALERRADDAVAILAAHYEGSLARVVAQMEQLGNRRSA